MNIIELTYVEEECVVGGNIYGVVLYETVFFLAVFGGMLVANLDGNRRKRLGRTSIEALGVCVLYKLGGFVFSFIGGVVDNFTIVNVKTQENKQDT